MRGSRAAWTVPLAAALTVAALAGCAGQGVMGARTAERPPAEVQELRTRVLELQRQAAVTEVELERLRRKLAELEARLEGRPPPAPERPPAAIPPPPRSSAGAAPPPREPVFEVEDLPPEEGSRRPTPPAAPPRAVVEPAPPSAGSAGEVTPEAQELYDRGYTLYHQGRYVDAESSFRRFIQSHPATELTDNAQYWIGESRLARGDVSGALAAFREAVERYPEGNKVPDALLKVGEAMATLGDVEGAREAYQEVIRRFAGTTAAAVARDRLEALP
jgi:tol-pal system protein YbgF